MTNLAATLADATTDHTPSTVPLPARNRTADEVIAYLKAARTLGHYRAGKRMAVQLSDTDLALVVDALIDARLRVDSVARTRVATDLAWEATQRRQSA